MNKCAFYLGKVYAMAVCAVTYKPSRQAEFALLKPWPRPIAATRFDDWL